MCIREVITYYTTDGKPFDTKSDAEKYQDTLTFKDNVIAWIDANCQQITGSEKLELTRSQIADILIQYVDSLKKDIKDLVGDEISRQTGELLGKKLPTQ